MKYMKLGNEYKMMEAKTEVVNEYLTLVVLFSRLIQMLWSLCHSRVPKESLREKRESEHIKINRFPLAWE